MFYCSIVLLFYLRMRRVEKEARQNRRKRGRKGERKEGRKNRRKRGRKAE